MSLIKFSPPLVLVLLWILTIPSGWAQTYKVLYSFTGGTDGAFPLAGVIRDSAGNLYGTSSGEQNGTVFKVSPKGKFKLLYGLPVAQGGALVRRHPRCFVIHPAISVTLPSERVSLSERV